ncbi:hypothetical protein [Alteromonas mediterranea]|nr:hypothetical protein [Alteromonas mediterranea]
MMWSTPVHRLGEQFSKSRVYSELTVWKRKSEKRNTEKAFLKIFLWNFSIDTDITFDYNFCMTQIPEPAISAQERTFISLVLRGVSPQAAAESLGMTSVQGIELYNQDHIQTRLMQMREMFDPRLYAAPEGIKFTKDQATMLLLESHRKSKDSTEEIKAVQELIKLHGLAAPEKKEIEITRSDQLRELDDRQLQEMAGMDIDLDPSSYAITYDDDDNEETLP